MVYDFVITLKRPNYKLVDRVSQLLYVFALAVFGFFIYSYPGASAPYMVISTGIIITWIITLLRKTKHKQAMFRTGLVFAAVGWIAGPEVNWWMAGLYMLAALLERQAKFPQEIGFGKTDIAFNTFPRKKITLWHELNNVVLRDGLITLDYKDNKLMQKEVDDDVSPQLEAEFNNFCSCMLHVHDEATITTTNHL